MEIKKIDDKPFRVQAVENFHWRDSPRRYELHITDFISCLLCTLVRKVLPEPDGNVDERYTQVLDWVGGLGFDNLITERISGKMTTWIGGVQGNIDMVFQDTPYELTSSLYLSKKVKESNDLAGYYQYKLGQLAFYMAGIGRTTGKLKIIERAGERRTDNGKAYGRPRPKEHTWRVRVSPRELAYYRWSLIHRKDVLCRALAKGSPIEILSQKHLYAPILSSSFCRDSTGFCKEIAHVKTSAFRMSMKEWLAVVMDNEENLSRTAQEVRRWM